MHSGCPERGRMITPPHFFPSLVRTSFVLCHLRLSVLPQARSLGLLSVPQVSGMGTESATIHSVGNSLFHQNWGGGAIEVLLRSCSCSFSVKYCYSSSNWGAAGMVPYGMTLACSSLLASGWRLTSGGRKTLILEWVLFRWARILPQGLGNWEIIQ